MLNPDPERIRCYLEAIAQPRDVFENSNTLKQTESYIEEQLKSFGYQVQKSNFEFRGQQLNNLIAKHPKSPSANPLLIGAHFDAVPGTPGADDNASGCAALLESARLLSQVRPEAAVTFIAFNAEEYGMLGSAHYASQLQKQQIKIQGMLSLEMVGYACQATGSQKMPLPLKPFYPDIGNFLALVGDYQSKKLMAQVKQVFQQIPDLPVETLSVPNKGWLFPETRLSDHSSFWDAGYPALLVTDTSFFRNPHYHTPADTIETLDLDFLAHITQGVVKTAIFLGFERFSD